EDSATLDAVARYRQSVRDEAPWLPNNVEFMRRINGLDSREQVRDILFQASYLVLGLGDVYLGAPCAVPIDPRHRLLTSKYNPARTFTAEGTVGIGGVYMCIYGMDSPGGYQLVGRTLPIWNKFLKNPVFQNDEPWLLRFFDQVRFYPVSEAELTTLREDFREGRATLRIEQEDFDFAGYRRFLAENHTDIEAFKATQQAAFEAEVALWQAEESAMVELDTADEPALALTTTERAVCADLCGNVWKIPVRVGQRVEPGDTLVIVEAMKMELSINAAFVGTITAICCMQGKAVNSGDTLLVIDAQADCAVT